MELQFWGVRGSFPVSGKDRDKYGGHTPCASIKAADGSVIIVDAGTGIKDLGDAILKEEDRKYRQLHLLLTHFHLDHITGLPFFAPLYSSRTVLNICADEEPGRTEKYLAGLMGGRYYPWELSKTPSAKNFERIPKAGYQIGTVKISWCPLRHPQGSVAYKFDEKGKSLIFATDTEHPVKGLDETLVVFAQGTDFLVYDATFTPEEYSGRRGWGHSTWLEGTKIAEAADIGTLCLSHLNPDYPDKLIDEIVARARRVFRSTIAARQGLQIVL
jgi:phosphoribosyl 1,2-cyclic phosphodiesterase